MSRGSGNSPIYFLRNAPGDFIFDQSKAPDPRRRGRCTRRRGAERKIPTPSSYYRTRFHLDFLIRTKLDVHMHTLFPLRRRRRRIAAAAAAAFELFAFFFFFSFARAFFFSTYYPRRTSPSRLHSPSPTHVSSFATLRVAYSTRAEQ